MAQARQQLETVNIHYDNLADIKSVFDYADDLMFGDDPDFDKLESFVRNEAGEVYLYHIVAKPHWKTAMYNRDIQGETFLHILARRYIAVHKSKDKMKIDAALCCQKRVLPCGTHAHAPSAKTHKQKDGAVNQNRHTDQQRRVKRYPRITGEQKDRIFPS